MARPLTLLGAWCVPEQDIWDDDAFQRYEICTYPWDDRVAFDRAAVYTSRVGERVLNQLAAGLNAVHGIAESTRYWRIILGPWLAWYIEAFYDRYACIRSALEQHGLIDTVGLDRRSYVVPADMADFNRLYVLDEYNLQLYSQILEALGVEMPRETLEASAHSSPRSSKQVLRAAAARTVRSVHSRAAGLLPIAVVGTGLSFRHSLRLWWSSGGSVLPFEQFPAPRPKRTAIDAAGRDLLRQSLQPQDAFERVLQASLPLNIPQAYVETFRQRRAAVAARTRRTRVMLSAFSWSHDEEFKLAAAEVHKRGGHLLATQHGGYYGMLRAMSPEAHEQAVSDRFYSWGWDNGITHHPVNRSLPALALAQAGEWSKRRAQPGRRGGIVLVSTWHPRYLYRFQSHPVGPQWRDYVTAQVRFVSALDPAARREVVLRPYAQDFGWEPLPYWRRHCPEVRFDSHTPMGHLFKIARLIVVDHPATTMLQALAANVPTLMYWDADRFSMRTGAETLFMPLRASGMLHGDPESAAAKFSTIAGDLEAWWLSPEIQHARAEFCSHFARVTDTWASEWCTELAYQLDEEARSRSQHMLQRN